MTPEREALERWLGRLALQVPEKGVIFDVGKPCAWEEYKAIFQSRNYRTIDRNPALGADITADVESDPLTIYSETADATICSGVTEQCDNPFLLRDGVFRLLKPGGLALWGVLCVGFGMYPGERFAFTPEGVAEYLKGYDWLSHEICYRDGTPSYFFVLGRKRP